MIRSSTLLFCTVFALLSACLPARADEAAAAPAPAAEPIGLRTGNLLFLPRLALRQTYNNNIFATPTGETSDMATQAVPEITVALAESRHKLELRGALDTRIYWTTPDENRYGYSLSLGGHAAATDRFRLPFSFSLQGTHEDREEDLTGQRPVKPLGQESLGMEGGAEFEGGSYGLGLTGRYRTFRNEDGRDRAGAPVIRSDADHDETGIEGRARFDFNRHNSLSLKAAAGRRDYQARSYQAGGFTGPKRNAGTYGLGAGWRFNYKGVLADLTAGFDSIDHSDAAVESLRAATGGLNVEYAWDDKTTVTVTASRGLYEDEEVVNPIVRSRAGVFVDYSLRESVLLGTGVDYENREFEGAARKDDMFRYRLMADYFLNDRLALGAEYGYLWRDSGAAGLDFGQSVMMLRLNGRL